MCYLPYCPSSKKGNGCGFVRYLGYGKGHIWPNLSHPLGCSLVAHVVHLWGERLCMWKKESRKFFLKKKSTLMHAFHMCCITKPIVHLWEERQCVCKKESKKRVVKKRAHLAKLYHILLVEPFVRGSSDMYMHVYACMYVCMHACMSVMFLFCVYLFVFSSSSVTFTFLFQIHVFLSIHFFVLSGSET